MNKIKKLFFPALFFFLPLIANAQTNKDTLNNPLGDNIKSIYDFIPQIVNAALGLSGVMALLAFIWGGINFMLSRGNEKMIQKGKDSMFWAVIGLLAVFSSYAIINLIFNILGVEN